MWWISTAALLLVLACPSPGQAQEPPQLTSFSLDLNEGSLTLIFNEAVDFAENFLTGLTIQNSMNQAGALYTLTGGNLAGETAGVEAVVVNLIQYDLNAIKANTQLAVNIDSTFLFLAEGIFLSSVSADQVSVAAVHQVSVFTMDVTAPLLVEFGLDLNIGLLHMFFDEPILLGEFNTSGVFLMSGIDQPVLQLPPDQNNLFGNGSLLPPVATFYTYYFTSDDLLYLNELSPPLTPENTFITMNMATAYDTNWNPSVRANNLLASVVVGPNGGLELSSFTLDLDSGIMDITFSAELNPEILDVTGLTLWSSRNESSGESFRLTYSGPNTGVSGSVAHVELGFADLVAVKANHKIATSLENTYLSVDHGTITDIDNNENQPSSPIQVENYVADFTQPVFMFFDLDMNTQTLNITFDEPIALPTVNTREILLMNGVQGEETYQLSQSVEVFEDNITVIIILTDDDIASLGGYPDLATRRGNTYLSYTANFVQDVNGIVAAELPLAIVRNFSPLLVLELSGFTLDLDVGALSFTNSLPLDDGYFNASYITLQNSASDPTAKYRLIGSLFDTRGEAGSSFTLLNEDVVGLIYAGVTFLNPATNSLSPIFLSTPKGFAQTRAGIQSSEIAMNEAVPVEAIADVTPPVLNAFSLSMNTGLIILTFSEVVNVSALNRRLSGISIQSTSTGDGESFTLSEFGGSTQNTDASVVEVILAPSSVNGLKQNSNLATSEQNTFLSLAQNTTFDSYGIGNVVTDGLQAFSYEPDMQSPQLLSFDLDMNTGSMTLTFSEPVRTHAFDFTSLTLHSAPSASSISLSLSGGTPASIGADLASISFSLSQSDVNSLTSTSNLAESADSTYLSMASSAVEDTNGNPVLAISVDTAIQVFQFTPLTGPPELTCFNLDMNMGILSLSFQKPVDFSRRLDLERITLQSTNVIMNSTRVVAFSQNSGTFEPNVGSSIQIQLSDSIIDELKVQTMPFDSNTYITLQAGVVVDNMDLDSVAITSDGAVKACDFTADTTQPRILRWSLDLLQENSVIIHFDEPVKVNSFRPDEFTIQARSYLFGLGPGIRIPNYQLKHSTAQHNSTDSLRTLKLNLNMDKVSLIADPAFCKQPDNTFLSCMTYAVRDYNDNSVRIVSYKGDAIQVESLLVDADPPSLTSFTLDLRESGRSEMNLTFNELVQVNSDFVRSLTVKMSEDDTNQVYTLANSAVRSTDLSYTVTISLSDEDLDMLCALSSRPAGCLYPLLYYEEGVVQDSFNNWIPAREPDKAFPVALFGYCSKSDSSKCPSDAVKPQPLGQGEAQACKCVSSIGMCCQDMCCTLSNSTVTCCSSAAGKATTISTALLIICVLSHLFW